MSKKFLIGLAAALVMGVAAVAWAQNSACNILNCREQGGSRWSVGGSLDVLSGGDLDIESGGSLKLAGTAVAATAAELNAVADASARVVTIVATDAITKAEHANRINLMADVGGDTLVTLTMPEATGTGDVYKFYVGVVNTSNYVIAALTSDTISGVIITSIDAADTGLAWEIDGTDDKLTLNGTSTGGVTIGDWVEFVDCLDTTWCVSGQITSSGSEATPASAT